MITRRHALIGIAAATAAPLFVHRSWAGTKTLVRGSFTGTNGHETRGTAGILEVDGAHMVSLGEDFFFDGAPDPKVALGNDGYDPNTLMGPLQSNTGAQNYPVPDSIDVAQYNEVWIWCERFNVSLGVAKMNLA
ncbi:MAG: DM13 domain-containing protein [Pseudomonadota bacterium]